MGRGFPWGDVWRVYKAGRNKREDGWSDAVHGFGMIGVLHPQRGGGMTMASKLKMLPAFPEDGDAEATVRALAARNALLVEALANMAEAWMQVRNEPVPEIEEVIRVCRAA